MPQNTDGLRRVKSKDIVYLLSADADLDDGYLVINTAVFVPAAGLAKPCTAFERVIRVALRHFDRGIAILSSGRITSALCFPYTHSLPETQGNGSISINRQGAPAISTRLKSPATLKT